MVLDTVLCTVRAVPCTVLQAGLGTVFGCSAGYNTGYGTGYYTARIEELMVQPLLRKAVPPLWLDIRPEGGSKSDLHRHSASIYERPGTKLGTGLRTVPGVLLNTVLGTSRVQYRVQYRVQSACMWLGTSRVRSACM